MPFRSRLDMHVGIDLGVNLLNSNMYGKLVPEIKDYFLNKAIDAFIEETVYKDLPIDNSRNSLSYDQILKKYNKIYTLITESSLTLAVKTTSPPIPNYVEATLPSDLYHFEASNSVIIVEGNNANPIEVNNNLPVITDINSFNQHPYSNTSLNPNTAIINNKLRIYDFNKFVISSAKIIYIKTPAKISGNASVSTIILAGTPTLGGSVNPGTHSYYITYTLNGSESLPSLTSNVVTAIVSTGQTIPLTLPLGPAGTTVRKIYRTIAGNGGSPLLLATISNNTTTTYTDTIGDATIIANNITAPTASHINCNLPIAFHDEIIDRAVTQIIAIGTLPNYQQVLNELIKNK